jgi:tight adherence protein C
MLLPLPVIVLLVFFSLSLCAALVLYFAFRAPDPLEKRIDRLTDVMPVAGGKRGRLLGRARKASASAADSVKEFVGGFAPGKGRKAEPRIQRLLTHAGYRKGNALRIYRGAKIFLAMVLFALYIPVGAWLGHSAGLILLSALLVAVAGYLLPDYWLRHAAHRRQNEIARHLPDALDLMVVCVEAGLGLDAAVARVSSEMRLASSALSSEFALVTQEIKAGKPRAQALRDLTVRTGVEDLGSLVAMLVQTDKLGTSVAQALRTHADTVRTRRRQRAEEAAAKTPVKLVFPLVLCIFPSLFVVILGPAVVTIVRTLAGLTVKA